MSKWQLYDDLINGIQDDIKVESIFVGAHWVGVKSEMGLGIAMRMADAHIKPDFVGKIKGMKLKDLASYIKSWDMHAASLGTAAVNSFYNGKNNQKNLITNTPNNEKDKSVFDLVYDKVKGKNVTVIGHFPNLAKLSEICNLTILERKPFENDLPDMACEYILHEQDYLFATGVTLINKTYPRLAELAEKAVKYMVGPSTPLTNIMFKHNADVLAGSVFTNEKEAAELFIEGAQLRQAAKNNAVFVQMVK